MTVQQLCPVCQLQVFNGPGLGQSQPLAWATSAPWSPANGFLAILLRLSILVIFVFIGAVFLRVLIELRIEQRHRKILVATQRITSLKPSEFEAYVGLLFRRAGYRVRRTGGTGDAGVDLVVHRRGRTSVVQCKRYEDNIGPSTVRELIGTMTNLGADHGFLVTTSRFTAGAEREAQKAPYSIDLVDGGRLVRWARRCGLPGDLGDAQVSDSLD